MNPSKIVIKFDQCDEQNRGFVRRIVGFAKALHLVPLYDAADLAANPRSAKTGSVTTDIISSITETPDLFPFKTKGILLGASVVRDLERKRYELLFKRGEIEGILDGGHNTLAIGIYMLSFTSVPDDILKRVRTWPQFKEAWTSYRSEIDECRELFDFLVPLEVLAPADPSDARSIEEFSMSLLEICAARNNNVELTEETKANKSGFYDELKSALPKDIADLVEWKTNDGGVIKARDIIALAWVPLLQVTRPQDIKVQPNQLYRNKGACVEVFNELMRHEKVSTRTSGYNHQLTNKTIKSAISLLKDLPALFEKLYIDFPEAYNSAPGHFGRISAVRMYDPTKIKEKNPKYLKKAPKSPFYKRDTRYSYPDGFLWPIFYGLSALMKFEDGEVSWEVDPYDFLEKRLPDIVRTYKLIMDMSDYDPQKVGKNISAYEFSRSEIEKFKHLARVQA